MNRVWLLVTGDFVPSGGQDRANYELAHYLAGEGDEVHLVCHRAHDNLRILSNIHVHTAWRPMGSHLLGASFLKRRARIALRRLQGEGRRLTVIANGGNYDGKDVNWVHAVHAAWEIRDEEAPWFVRLKNRVAKRVARRDELKALGGARVVIVNSEGSLQKLAELGIARSRLKAVYLGSDGDASVVTAGERSAARREYGLDADGLVAVFIGSLGYDRNKGFDVALEIVRRLRLEKGWQLSLLAAGGGQLDFWARRIERAGMEECVRVLGHLDSTRTVVAAADFLLSPSRYESYGLAVHEALSRGVPSFVSGNAGIAELLPSSLSFLKLADVEDATRCARQVAAAFPLSLGAQAALRELGNHLRQRTWTTMAQEIENCAGV